MLDLIPFAIGAAVLLWGTASFAHALAGGERAGRHHVSPAFAGRVSGNRSQLVYRALNYVVGLTVFGMTITMVVLALLYS